MCYQNIIIRYLVKKENNSKKVNRLYLVRKRTLACPFTDIFFTGTKHNTLFINSLLFRYIIWRNYDVVDRNVERNQKFIRKGREIHFRPYSVFPYSKSNKLCCATTSKLRYATCGNISRLRSSTFLDWRRD